MARKRKNPALSQALLEAQVAYSPQFADLSQQGRQAKRNFGFDIASAAGTHRGIDASINAARPQLQQGYGQAEGTRGAAYKAVIPGLSSLSPAADVIKASIIAESAGSKARLGQERAGALGDLTSRHIEAAAGE